MKNKFSFSFVVKILILNFIFFNSVKSQEPFNFNVTEVEILDNGNTFIGKKRGEATTQNNIVIIADRFEYDKKLNILYANGNVIIKDTDNNLDLFSNDITYKKNEEFLFSKSRSKATDKISTIEGNEFEYDKKLNILNVSGQVIYNDTLNDYTILTDDITYKKNEEFSFLNQDQRQLTKFQRLRVMNLNTIKS